MRNTHHVAFAIAAAALMAGCGTEPTSPASESAALEARPTSVPKGAVKFWEVGASVAWNERAGALLAARGGNQSRLYAYLGMAQYRAAEAAAALPGPHPPISAAIGAASAVVLKSFFPLDATTIEAALDAQQAADPWPGAKRADFVAGEAIGRAIGARVNAFALGDRANLADPLLPPYGPPPTTPGSWVYVSGGPIARGNLGMRPFFLASAGEFRSPPPPAFGSQEFLAALAEVRSISDNRTQQQRDLAVFWHLNQSPSANGPMNALARELIVRHRRSDLEAARILFLTGAAAYDALIGCFDAKYHYWYIRPPQADPAITVPAPIIMPPHPSYPSAHSCISGGMTGVLALAFPSERDRVEAMAVEASTSRIYAGIHYRFDAVAGLALGRAAAGKAFAADLGEAGLLP